MKRTSAFIGIVGTLLVGLVIGLLISSNLDFTPAMEAGEDQVWSEEALVDDSASGPPASFAPIAEKALPGVVIIHSTRIVRQQPNFKLPQPGDPHYEFFRRFFNMPGQGRKTEKKVPGIGSGFIINEDGYILTNYHVIAQAPDIEVEIENGKRYKAEVVGSDKMSDLALLKIEAEEDLTALPLGDSDLARVGDWVIAIGSPFRLFRSVTVGVVSYKARTWSGNANLPRSRFEFIQTDAPLNVGSSGGPLLNSRGQVIGINSAILSPMGAAGGNIGIGFAIPSNLAKDFLPQLMKGQVIYGWLGVYIQEITPELAEQFGLSEGRGALVTQVVADSPAQKGKIEQGDVIVEYEDDDIRDYSMLSSLVARTPPGTKVSIKVLRSESGDDEPREIKLKVKIAQLQAKADAKQEQQSAQTEEQVEDSLGLSVSNVSDDLQERFGLQIDRGVVITAIAEESPAASANLAPGDVILEVNRKRINNVGDFIGAIGSSEGDSLLLLTMRRDATQYVVVKRD
jgi:serine protease Do